MQDDFAAGHTRLQPSSLWSGLPRLETNQDKGVTLSSSLGWTTQGGFTSVERHGECVSLSLVGQSLLRALSMTRGPRARVILCLCVSSNPWTGARLIVIVTVV